MYARRKWLILRMLLGIFHSECSKDLDLSVSLNMSSIENILQLPTNVPCPIIEGIKRIFLTE